jgi:hypothetical protein
MLTLAFGGAALLVLAILLLVFLNPDPGGDRHGWP